MKNAAKFRQRLQNGDICLGAAITLADPAVTDALGDSVDFFWIDLEHTPMSPHVVHGHLLAARAHGVPALVRITGNSTPFIKPVLDGGADGIIAPQVRSAEEARQIVAECRYPPVGQRGFGPMVASNYMREASAAFLERANREIFVGIQMENVEAYEAIDEIVSVPGVDSIVIGPWDLSISMGYPGELEHPRVVEAIETVIAKTRAAGLYVGAGMGVDPEYAARMARRGVQWLQVAGDVGYLLHTANQTRAAIHKLLS